MKPSLSTPRQGDLQQFGTYITIPADKIPNCYLLPFSLHNPFALTPPAAAVDLARTCNLRLPHYGAKPAAAQRYLDATRLSRLATSSQLTVSTFQQSMQATPFGTCYPLTSPSWQKRAQHPNRQLERSRRIMKLRHMLLENKRPTERLTHMG